MTVLTKRPLSLAEFLDWEEQQEGRFEFNGREPERMVGRTARHSAIKLRLYRALMAALQGSRFHLLDSDMKVEAAGRIRYPDASVAADPLPPEATIVREPIVLFEVLSDRTAITDRTVKNAEYRATRSVRRYVMLEPERMAATVFEQVGEEWVEHRLNGRDAVLDVPEIGVRLTLGAIYENLIGEDGDTA